jgi:predicted XRE-type DNA-binding protein
MVNYREILRLNSLKYSQRQIAASVHSSRDTVSEVIKLAEQHGLNWPLDEAATNEFLSSVFYPDRITQLLRTHDMKQFSIAATMKWLNITKQP